MRVGLLVATLAACSYAPPRVAIDADADPGPGDGDDLGARPIVPSNHPDTSALDAGDLPSLIMDHVDDDAETVWRIYTDTGLIEHEAVGVGVFVEHRAMGTGTDVTTRLRFEQVGTFAVLFVDRLEVAANVSFEGHGTRPLIVIARSAITITGEIDFSGGFIPPSALGADFRLGGPGGGNGADNTNVTDGDGAGCGGTVDTGGASAGISANGDGSGGGGGGGGLDGQKGGDKSAGSDVGGPGGATCITATLIPLVGGAGGGAGDTAGGGGPGGGGGGAIQLSSMTSVFVAGVIDAGGKGGFAQVVNDEGGGGGGGGGGILIEAPTVTITGTLAANGGGGGSGRVANNNGAQGTLTEIAALGGAGSGGGDGSGGNGGAKASVATAGDDHDPGGGGGGGGAGVVRLNVATSVMVGPLASVSPQFTEGAVVFQ